MKQAIFKINGAPAPAGELTADTDNSMKFEGQNAVETSGQTVDATGPNTDDPNKFQLAEAMNRYAAVGTFYVDSGAADAYVLTGIGSFKAITAYIDGMEARFRPANNNTGAAATINISGIGVVSLTLPDGSNPPLGAILNTKDLKTRYNAGSTRFEIIDFIPAASTTVSGIVELATAAETDAGTDNVRAVTPLSLGVATQSLAANGYQRLPGGLIIQWGQATTGGGGSVTVNFPIVFPNALFSLSFAPFVNTAVFHSFQSPTATSFFLQSWDTTGAAAPNATVRYIAIGH